MHFHHDHEANACGRDHGWPDYVHALFATINRGVTAMTEAQQHLDADVQALTAAFTAIAAEVDALKSQPAADGVDFSGLDALVAQAQAAVPAAPAAPAEPAPAAPAPAADGSAPADGGAAPAPADPSLPSI